MPGPVQMIWCSATVLHDETFPENTTQTDAEYREDCAKWVEEKLTQYPPTADCT